MQKVRTRANGEGTLCRRKDGLYCAACFSTTTGKRHYFYGKSRSIVKEKMDTFREQEVLHLNTDRSKTTIVQFTEEWLQLMQSRLRPHIHTEYTRYVHRFVNIYGHLHIQRLTANHLQSLYGQETKRGTIPTALRLHRVIHKLLADAVTMRLIPYNPADAVILPKHRTEERIPLSTDEAKTLLRHAQEENHTLIQFALLTGMRQGELLGLKWSDIDALHKSITIQRTLRHIPGMGATELPPKTQKGKRTIALTEYLISVLEMQRKRQLEAQLKAGSSWQKTPYVFTSSEGLPLRNEYVLRSLLHPMLQRAGLPAIRFHDLRHSTASLLLHLGAQPKDVQALLGHSRIDTTMSIYAHVIKTEDILLSRLDSLVIGL